MDTVTRIFDLIKGTGKSVNAFAVDCKINAMLFNHWKNGRQKPSIDALTKIADYFSVSVDYLIGREVVSNKTIPNNATIDPLFNRIQQLNELQRAKLEAYLDGLQGTDTSISNAFKQGQRNEINNQQQLTKNKNQLN